MKPFNELTPGHKFFRQNIVRLIIYGGFALTLYWSISEIKEIKQNRDQQQAESEAVRAQILEVRSELEKYDRIEETKINFYREANEQADTVGMAVYMKQHLSPAEYILWLEEGKL